MLLPDEIAAKLSPAWLSSQPDEVLDEIASLLDELEAIERETKLYRLYPDTGPLRRELYPKHLEFFRAGGSYMERAAIAANRVGKCVTADTVIETRSGDRTVKELFDAGLPVPVWAWDGQRRVAATASAPFQKMGWHQCYRVTMSDGRWFEAADDHRILTDGGFCFLGELHRSFSGGLLRSSSGRVRSVHALGERSCVRTPSDCRDGCSGDCRQCGGQPRRGIEAGQASSPSSAGALQRIAAAWREGGPARTRTNSRRLASGLLSNPDARRRVWARLAELLFRSADTSALQLCGQSRGWLQLPAALPSQPRSNAGGGRGFPRTSLAWRIPDIDGVDIVSVDPVGRNTVYDFTVPHFHNYVTAGVVHHNTWGLGGYETTLHLTGLYPEWWEGRRFSHPIEAWAAGDTSETTRDIVQAALMGQIGELGTGLIPRANIVGEPKQRRGVADAFDLARIRHKSGGISLLGFKSFDQGRRKFQGTAKHVVWLDEEPPEDVYDECLLRLMTTKGIMIGTFTPLQGLSKIVLRYMQELQPAL